MGGAFADAAEPEYNFVRKQNGGTKHFDGTIALNIHILSSPSYFARDCFDKLFA